jgi:hypothetical protein
MCLIEIFGEVTQRYKTNITPYKKIFSANYLMIKNISTDYLTLSETWDLPVEGTPVCELRFCLNARVLYFLLKKTAS